MLVTSAVTFSMPGAAATPSYHWKGAAFLARPGSRSASRGFVWGLLFSLAASTSFSADIKERREALRRDFETRSVMKLTTNGTAGNVLVMTWPGERAATARGVATMIYRSVRMLFFCF
jgi:hypothetical protein